ELIDGALEVTLGALAEAPLGPRLPEVGVEQRAPAGARGEAGLFEGGGIDVQRFGGFFDQRARLLGLRAREQRPPGMAILRIHGRRRRYSIRPAYSMSRELPLGAVCAPSAQRIRSCVRGHERAAERHFSRGGAAVSHAVPRRRRPSANLAALDRLGVPAVG